MSRALLAQLDEQRKTIAAQSRGILDAAAEAKRELTAQEDADFTAATGQMVELNARAKSIIAGMEAEAEAESIITRALGNAGAANGGESRGAAGPDLDVQFRRMFNGEMSVSEMRGFEVSFDKGSFRSAQTTALMSPSQRALAKSANTVGVTFKNELTQHLVDTTSVLQVCTIWQTDKGESIDAPITTSHGASAGLTAEGVSFTGTDPTISKRTLGAYAYKQLIKLSTELVEDAGFDIVGYVAEALGINAGLALGTDIAVGNGSSKPSGIVQTASTGVTGGASVAGAFTADNLVDLYHSVNGRYRRSPKCAWLVRDATLAAIRKLKDGASQYLFTDWTSEPIGNAEGRLLGKSVYTDPNIAAVALSAKSVVFGDMSKFVVRIVNGVRFERSDDYAFNTDEVAFRAVIRGDSVLLDQTGAVKVFVGNAA